MSALRNNLLPKTRSVINCLISFLEKRPKLHKFVLGIAQKHDNLIGYRKYGIIFMFCSEVYIFLVLGLFRDDIISENDPVIQEALKRLSDKEAFDRTFRLRRAIQLNLNHDVLPPSEQTKPEQVN
jgi:ubiquinol-cytochrome c reductase subunit 7